ncbi:hypothetical protein ACI8B_260036 [Acinetobacter proteolyticus]|uniref:Uncharacterized protein n=1 Tax=Acinetobacter proteolyticus TaxID=1776741 RepID=A0A653K563_9GAMM|nr:hypothetical protein ACI8B_260036 [Acinetobacter proteolyticus]
MLEAKVKLKNKNYLKNTVKTHKKTITLININTLSSIEL